MTLIFCFFFISIMPLQFLNVYFHLYYPQVKKRNSVKDFISVSGPLHVSHLLIVTNTQVGPSLRIMRTPKGPTLTFRIHSYSLSQDILSSAKKQVNADKMYKHPPLIVLNNFTSEENHMKLMATMFQNMFPTINVTKVTHMYVYHCEKRESNGATGEILDSLSSRTSYNIINSPSIKHCGNFFSS